MATEKQITYALRLLKEAGYDIQWMGAQYKKLGVVGSQRRGTVRAWLAGLETVEISELIDRLKPAEPEPQETPDG